MTTIALTCPLCHSALTIADRRACCEHGHSFDQAKQGYWNLLPVQNKKTRSPGDDRSMLDARRRFLEAGHYRPLVEHLAADCASGVGLDLGCGEGWYARQLNAAAGVDIAKDGVRMAASQQKAATFVVGSNVATPFQRNQFDWVLCVFAPFDLAEVQRLLKPGGRFIHVGPGSNHLRALAAQIYDQPSAHATAATTSSLGERATLDQVRVELHLKEAELADLHQMTPYFWSTPADKRSAIEQHPGLDVVAEFDVRRLTLGDA
ncbi:putative RNA methyltransferase [Litorivicinus lipolyticus]|uniref:putative RNA methyltransferase n=1 Tax=Litorivicinus lipolyticus TaxID=418701 RepID=UPI003B5BDCAD